MLASENGHTAVVQALMAAQADVNRRNYVREIERAVLLQCSKVQLAVR
jgi:hypothetical protein